MRSDKYEPRICVICGKEYIPRRKDQRSCASAECKKAVTRMAQRRYREENYGWVLECNRRGMAKRRAEKKRREAEERDTIIAIGYADRQMAETLEMAGKIRTEL